MATFFRAPGWVLPLARRVLYLWVRPTVFPKDPQSLGVDPSRPVCYVLQDHRYSNRLVLSAEALRCGLPSAEAPLTLGGVRFARSAFFLNPKPMLAGTARERYAPPAMMEALVREALFGDGADLQIVPVVILWGRRPDKEESILRALFSETWRQAGALGHLLTILLNGRNVLVRFNAPISLHALAREQLGQEQALRKLSRVLRVHFRRQREMAIGPDLSHRNTQIETLLQAPAVRLAIADEAARLVIPIDEAERRARRFALEIASDYSYGAVRALELFLSWLWNRLYDGIEIHNIDVVTQIAPGHGIVYVPTHRSHVDYLLLSYCLHRQGLTPPHIAAGANLNMLLIGPLLRRCGAFFLRRSFKGEPLYAAVFHEYLHLMMSRGFPLEYFIEGGRSRSGRMLTPKAGILGMTVRSFIREHARPLVFVPIYIGYEKVIEGRTYVRELSGKPKQRESLWGVLQSARQIRKIFGKVHINFGRPLPLAGFLDSYHPDWASAPAGEDDWPRLATRDAAIELARRLNEAAVINPVNLIALALLATPRHTADEVALKRLLAHYEAIVRDAPYSQVTIACPLSPDAIVDYCRRLRIVERIDHPLGALIALRESQSALLAYYRNNVLHVFALPALIACLATQNRDLGSERIAQAVAGIYGLLQTELFLRWPAAELEAATRAIVDVFVARGLLVRDERGLISAPEPNSQEFVELKAIGEAIRTTLERHFLTLALLQQSGSGSRSKRTLENDCHLLAQRLALLYATSDAAYSEVTTFSALIVHLIDADFLSEDERGLLSFDERLLTPLKYAELVLPVEARQTIRRMASATLEG
jgi:glycerol-3-phosphate O-acyltransferase